jgi:hypothetical protein
MFFLCALESQFSLAKNVLKDKNNVYFQKIQFLEKKVKTCVFTAT